MPVSLTHLNHPAAALRRAVVGVLLTVLTMTAAQAQETALSARRHHPVTIAVVGDSMANDLGNGMEDLFARHANVRVVKKTRFATGLVRTDYYNWDAEIREFLATHDPDVILVLIGGNDRQPIRLEDDRRLDPLTRPWMTEYRRRVSKFMQNIRRERARTFWIGLPAVRSDALTQAYQAMNRMYRYEARRHGFKYVSIWNEFLSPSGGYTSFGQSLEGVRRRLRQTDGMHFNETGRLSLAAYVAHAIGLR